MSQVIPGLRDTRTPLAVGALWVIALWIGFALIPDSTLEPSKVQVMISPLKAVPIELTVAIGILVTYVFGIFMEMLSRHFRKLLFGSFLVGWTVMMMIVLGTEPLLDQFWSIITSLVSVLAVMFAAVTVVEFVRLRKSASMGDAVAYSVEETARVFVEFFARRYRDIRAIFRPDRGSFEELLGIELEDIFGNDPEMLLNAMRQINGGVLSDAAVSMGLSVEKLHDAASGEQRTKIQALRPDDLIRYILRDDPEMEALARGVMLQEITTYPAARRAFAATIYNMDALKENLHVRLDQAEVDLRANAPDLFQEYDRLRAEGEFRRGVSLPMCAILSGLGVLLFDLFSLRLTTSWLVTLLAAAAVVGLTLHSAGSRRLTEANRLLYSCVKRGKANLGERRLFGSELFIPTETTVLPRTSLVSYKIREVRNALILRTLGWALSKLRAQTRCTTCGQPAEPSRIGNHP
ncbi:hypothetical protein [Micromonospora sp. CPCC 206061]|uniref:hypothetical protein n=1 Tax=Micromonospora sp. CPCC 206061 TaxID=3122410 RepID=UPI002FF319BE